MYINKLNKYKLKLEDLIGGEPNMNNKKLLGSGTYGCIISPPLKCHGDPERPKQPNFKGLNPAQIAVAKAQYISDIKAYTSLYKNKVSKLIDSKEANIEFADTRVLAALDPDNRYFSYPIKNCNVEIDNLYKDEVGTYIDAIQECKADFNDEDYDLKLLYSTYSGKRISKLKLNHSNVPVLLTSLRNILEGVNILHTNNLVHLDLKSDNVLVTKTGDVLVPHIIDFGIMINIPDFFSNRNSLLNSYYIWPIELKFLANNFLLVTSGVWMRPQIESYINPTLQEYRNNLHDYLLPYGIPYHNFLYKDNVLDPVSGMRRDTPLGSIYNNDATLKDLISNLSIPFLNSKIYEWKKSLPKNPDDLSKVKLDPGTIQFDLYGKILKGVDIYSIGILFLEIYARYVGQVISTSVNIFGKQYKLLDVDYNKIELDPTFDPKLIEYLNLLFDELTVHYSEFCSNCIKLKYMERLDAPTALSYFTTHIIPRFAILSDPRFELLCKLRGLIEETPILE